MALFNQFLVSLTESSSFSRVAEWKQSDSAFLCWLGHAIKKKINRRSIGLMSKYILS